MNTFGSAGFLSNDPRDRHGFAGYLHSGVDGSLLPYNAWTASLPPHAVGGIAISSPDDAIFDSGRFFGGSSYSSINLADLGPHPDYGIGSSVVGISNTSSVGTTGNFVNQDINGLLSGVAWGAGNITFSFPSAASNYGGSYSDSDALGGWEVLGAAHQAVVRYALGLISQYTLLTFTEIAETDTTHAMLRFSGSSFPPTSFAYYPSTGDTGGDVWYGNIRNTAPTKAGYEFDTILHEIGHALGLKHGHEDDGTHGTLPAVHNSTEWSIMDYHSYIGGDLFYRNADGSGNQTYMIDDIAALQYMYGANFSTNSGNTVYTWSPATGEMFIGGAGQGASSTNTIYEAIWDGNGIDTYDLSNYTTNLSIDLRPGEWSTFSTSQLAYLDNSDSSIRAPGNISNAHLYNNDPRSYIERAYGGSGNDVIIGNPANNFLKGGAGNDVIYLYNGGNDVAHGDGGNDTFNLSGALTAWDQIDGGSGTDTVNLSGNYAAGVWFRATTMVNVETLSLAAGNSYKLILNDANVASGQSLTVDGSALGASNTLFFNGSAETGGRFVLRGGAGNDTLFGGAGNDTIAIWSGGTDVVRGYGGNDTFNVSGALTAWDQIDGGSGTDTVLLNGNYSAGVWFRATTIANVETLSLAAGNSYKLILNNANVASGQSLTVDGSALGASNTLFFNGSAETDGYLHLTGGAGNDTLFGGARHDVISGGTGADRLTGGGGADYFAYGTAADSTGPAHDTIVDFDAATDKFDFSFAVTGVDAAVTGGALSTASFNADLATAAGSGQLAGNHALLFTADSGTLSGHTFLIVDANGVAGYQAGADFVFDVTGGANLASLGTGDFI